jgi:hypothetical protein
MASLNWSGLRAVPVKPTEATGSMNENRPEAPAAEAKAEKGGGLKPP